MIVIDGKNIIISKGDTFNVVFKLINAKIAQTDEIIFTVKSSLSSQEILLQKNIPYTSADKIEVAIGSDEMLKLKTGRNVYDLLVKSADNKTTLNFPASLYIKEVVHNEQT